MQRSQKNLLAGYISKAAKDPRLNTTQLSLYMALLYVWQNQQCITSFRISRKELMQLSKIASTSTYHICIKKMIDVGYLKYEPTYNCYKGSRITLL